jgi:large subunit GTPase 1
VCSAEELKNAENDAFLEWRRKLAVLQEERDALITPYEKNLEFWRQLWRVIERSDLVIQVIVPASPRRHREQRSRHSGDCAGKRKRNLLVWRQPRASSRAAISLFR